MLQQSELWLIVAVVVCGTMATAADDPGASTEVRERDLAAQCQRLQAKEFGRQLGISQALRDWIDGLAKADDRDALRFIVTRQLPGCNHAAMHYAKLLGPNEGLKFLRSLGVGSSVWRQTLQTLGSTGSLEIRAYNQGIIQSGRVPAFCYTLDMRNNWGDLTQLAWKDLDSRQRVYDGDEELVLGDLAREYLTKFEKARPIPPRIYLEGELGP